MKTLREEWVNWIGGEENLDLALGDGVFPSAEQYIAAGISVAEYQQWYSVNGWDIDCMKQLVAAGIDIDRTGAVTNEGIANYSETIAYKFCNGDISIEDVRHLIAD